HDLVAAKFSSAQCLHTGRPLRCEDHSVHQIAQDVAYDPGNDTAQDHPDNVDAPHTTSFDEWYDDIPARGRTQGEGQTGLLFHTRRCRASYGDGCKQPNPDPGQDGNGKWTRS